MRFGSLFAGIEGFGKGFEDSGMECVWQCDLYHPDESEYAVQDHQAKLDKAKDEKAIKKINAEWSHLNKYGRALESLNQKHFPNAKRVNDVRNANRTTLDPVDLICGGFPCQDLSVAGKRAGLAGQRSGLWYEFHRVIAECQPRWVVIENVPGLLSSGESRDFAVLLRGLDELGYGVAWRVFDARYFGVAQRRRRVFLVCYLGNVQYPLQVLFESESMPGDTQASREARQENSFVSGTLSANGGGLDRPAGNANGLDFCIARTLDQSSADASRTGQANETDFLIAHAVRPSSGKEQRDGSDNLIIVRSLTSHNDRIDAETETLIAFDYCIKGSDRTQIARTGGEYAQLQASRPDAIAFTQNTRDEVRVIDGSGQVTGALSAESGAKQQPYIHNGVGVRRLMPIECERLQGFPDRWTEGYSDSIRYKMLGNAVNRNVAEWLGKRIVKIG